MLLIRLLEEQKRLLEVHEKLGLAYKGVLSSDIIVYSVVREYAIPECVGCMVKVEYFSKCIKSNDDGSLYVTADSVLYKSSFDKTEDIMFDVHCLMYDEDCTRLFYDTYVFKKDDDYTDGITELMNNMFRISETKIKNLLGLERIA